MGEFVVVVEIGKHVLEPSIRSAHLLEPDEAAAPVEGLVNLIDQYLPIARRHELDHVISDDEVGLLVIDQTDIIANEIDIGEATTMIPRLVNHGLDRIDADPADLRLMLVVFDELSQNLSGGYAEFVADAVL